MTVEPCLVARALLGWPGRMISSSKSGYRERYRDNLAVFNANVCLTSGKIWHGDLDLTLDEPHLLDLARQLNEPVFVLYEQDGRFSNEPAPRLERAVYCSIPPGIALFDQRLALRDLQGTLRRRRPAPTPTYLVTPADWDGRKRPRLLRVWRLDYVRSGGTQGESNRLLYVGDRDGHASPLLVLGLFRSARPFPSLTIETTWYASPRPHLSTACPTRSTAARLGRVELRLSGTRWPGFMHEARLTILRRPEEG